MKKFAAIFLLVLYSSLNIVSQINLHFCHGNLVDFAINVPAVPCCDSDSEIQASCCSNVSINIELDKNQIVQNSLEVKSIKLISVLFLLVVDIDVFEISAQNINSFVSDSPPGALESNLYLLNNSFLFYG